MVPQLNVALVPAPDQVVLRLTGDVDLSTSPLVADALGQAAGLGTPQVVVDLGSARFWDCSGLHELVRFTRELQAAGRSCRVVGAQPAARRLIGMANLTAELQLDVVRPAAAFRGNVAARTPGRRVRRAAASVTGDLVAAGHAR
ncbi:STAS domain-containing protein [Blastococcus sp. SYSU D00922]